MSPRRAARRGSWQPRRGLPGPSSRRPSTGFRPMSPCSTGTRDRHDQRRLGAVRVKRRPANRVPAGTTCTICDAAPEDPWAKSCRRHPGGSGAAALSSSRWKIHATARARNAEFEADRYAAWRARRVMAVATLASEAKEELRTQAALLDEVNVRVAATDAEQSHHPLEAGETGILYRVVAPRSGGTTRARGDRPARPPRMSPR